MSSASFVSPPLNSEWRSLCEIVLLPPKDHLQIYFEKVMAILSEYFPIKYSALFLQDPQKKFLRLEGLYGFERENHPLTCTDQKGIMSKVLESRQPMAIHNISQEPGYEDVLSHEKIQSPLLCVPLMTDGELLGVINVTPLYHPEGGFIKDFQFLSILSAILSPVIKNYQLKREVPPAKGIKVKAKSHHLDEILEERLTEVMDKIAPYAETKMKMGIFDDIIRAVEKILIKSALEKVNHVQVAAAQLLGINRNTLRKKIKELKIKTR